MTTDATTPPRMSAPDARLRRLRWTVRAILTLGVAASVAANVLHARAHPVSQMIAAWPPLALLLTVELISRVPVHRRSLAAVRLAATAAIAGIAAWVSYWHMAGVAARYGETGAAAYLLPLSVDGLVIVASVSLIEIAGRIRTATSPHPRTGDPVAMPTDAVGQGIDTAGSTGSQADRYLGSSANDHSRSIQAVNGRAAPSTGTVNRVAHPVGLAATTATAARPDDVTPAPTLDGRSSTPPPPSTRASISGPSTNNEDPHDPQPVSGESVPSKTGEAVAYWRAREPTMHPAEIAARIGRSERAVRRYLPPARRRGTAPPQSPS